MADTAGLAVEAARSRTIAGRALAARGESQRAIEELARAEATLSDAGAERWRDEAARELRKLGQRVPRPAVRAARADGTLSRRERQVAELAAAGKTNREIAAELYLSPKTVETHIAHILDKLGVSSRSAIGAVLERERGEPIAH